jgi:hypothetical protein
MHDSCCGQFIFTMIFCFQLDSHTMINSKTVFYHIYSCHLDPNHTINFMLDLYFDIYDIKINLKFFIFKLSFVLIQIIYWRFLSYTDSIWNKTLHIKYLFILMSNAYITITNFNTWIIYILCKMHLFFIE